MSVLMKYDFNNSIVNTGDKSYNLMNLSVNQLHNDYYESSSSLLYSMNEFDVSNGLTVSFDFQYISGEQGGIAWNHIFAFGTHINGSGSDAPLFPVIGFGNDYYNVWLFNPQDFVDITKWHNYVITVKDNGHLIEGFIDNHLVASKLDTLSKLKSLYFGGCGYYGTLLYNIKNLVIYTAAPKVIYVDANGGVWNE